MKSALVFVFVSPSPTPYYSSSTYPNPATPTANFLETSKTPNHLATLFSFSFSDPNLIPRQYSYCRPRHHHVLYYSSPNKLDLAPNLDEVDDDADPKIDVGDDLENEDVGSINKSINIEIEKTGTNCRRIQSEFLINLLTDYERLSDFIPGLAVYRLLHKTNNYARLFQIGEQNLAFDLEFNAQGIVDYYETPLESLPNIGLKREI